MMQLSEIANLLNVSVSTDVALTGVSIDSRQVIPGNLFIALAGDRFDGHTFVNEAIAAGAAAVICSRDIPDITLPQLVVKDPIKALAAIASAHRHKLSCEVIALTGSNGKTTVKEMIAKILPEPSYATPGNLNNHIGVPLSVLQLKEAHRYAVFELGANHSGEISYTVAIAQPKVVLINNIAPAHIGEFGSIEGVARAKGEIYQGVISSGTAVVNDDDNFAHFWDSLLTHVNILRFSAKHPSDIYAKEMTYDKEDCGRFCLVVPDGEIDIKLHVPGAHNVQNALAAAACTYALGIPLTTIAEGLAQFYGVGGRMTFLQGKNNAVIIDDTYNANLSSSLSALDVLAKRPGRRVFVFGDMGELGDWSEDHHRDVGTAAHERGIELLMTCGAMSELTSKAYGLTARHYLRQDDLIRDLLVELNANTTVLVKGSRSSAMEKIVHQLVG
jgi:UDP-N-acetylmuramoyl-tripeptide--D-alanyl-D-alanine ligase